MAKAKKKANCKPVFAWMSAFDSKSGMAMASLKGETLSADGAGTLYACANEVIIALADDYVPVPRRGTFVVTDGRVRAQKGAAKR